MSVSLDEKSKALDDEKEIKVLKGWLVHKMRRLSYMWFHRKAALRKARISRGKYTCAHCTNIFGPKQINVDHIDPVVPTSGWDNWDGFISRLFCKEEGFQILCHGCHDTKTASENVVRTQLNPDFRSKKKSPKVARSGRKIKRKVKK